MYFKVQKLDLRLASIVCLEILCCIFCTQRQIQSVWPALLTPRAIPVHRHHRCSGGDRPTCNPTLWC